MPEARWATRFGLPILIIGLAGILLVVVGWQSLRPATEVEAVTVVVNTVDSNTPSPIDEPNQRIIQAPGWVEADPYSIYAGALVEGVVESILVLEGDRVAKGQPVARLISEDARIARDQAAAQWSVAAQQVISAKAIRDAIDPELAAADARRRSLVDEY